MEFVKIKGFKNGILLDLSSECEFDQLCQELASKMDMSKKMLGETLAAVKIQGRSLSSSETDKFYYIIKNHTNLKIACIYTEDDSLNVSYKERLNTLLGHEYMEKLQDIISQSKEKKAEEKSANIKASIGYDTVSPDGTDTTVTFQKFNPSGELIKKEINPTDEACVKVGSLKNGEIVNSDKDIVIIGDVPKGAIVSSEKNIYILGCLEGEGYAGAITRNSKGDKEAIIFALEMDPEAIKIAEISYDSKKSLFNKNKKKVPSVCYRTSKGIVIDTYKEGLINN